MEMLIRCSRVGSPHEVDNPNTSICIWKEMLWCAYERSAYYLTQMEVPVVLKKEVIHDDYDVVSTGFAAE